MLRAPKAAAWLPQSKAAAWLPQSKDLCCDRGPSFRAQTFPDFWFSPFDFIQ